MSSFIEELKAKNDIVSVISRYVPLEHKGRLFWGKCPFHGEKTPSFAVNEYDQFYHCFGCGAGGDVIKFVEEIESVDFKGAVQILADWAHMEVPSYSDGVTDEGSIKKKKEERDRLLALMKDAARHYVDNLKVPQSIAGRIYFEKRNISPQIARIFGLGFSLNFYEIINYLQGKGYSLEEMQKVGIIKYKDGKPYDSIGGRIVFPIMDTASNVIGFCGRTLESSPDHAKYINTADTVLFNKSKNLYAINLVKKAKQTQGKIDPLIVVEGQMDVVSLHKAGFNTAVASMGTALTSDQAKLIKRFSDKVYICYDGDTAGKKATLRGLDILKDCGLDVYVVSMPEGLDPDDVINKYGSEGYRKLLEKALPLIDFKLEFLKKVHDVSSSDGKTKYVNEAIEILLGLSEVEREVYIDKVSAISGLMKDFIRRQLESRDGNKGSKTNLTSYAVNAEPAKVQEKTPVDNKVVQAEKFILSAMLHKKPYAFFKSDISKYFTDGRDKLYKLIVQLAETTSEKDMPKIFYNSVAKEDEDELDEEQKNANAKLASEIINYLMKNFGDENDQGYFKDCVAIIYKNYTEQEIARLTKLLDSEPEKEKRAQILTEIKELMNNIKNKKVGL